MIMGITGPTGAGKTEISKKFAKFGFYVFDLDLISRDIINKNSECWEKIKKIFGKETVSSDGRINRKILGEYAFKNRNTLYKLNQIVHPVIFEEMKKRVSHLNEFGQNAVIDAAALIEIGLDSLCDYVVFVFADEEKRLDRIMKRDKISKETAYKRIKAQASKDFYRRKKEELGKRGFYLKCLLNEDKMVRDIENILNKIGGLNSKYEE